MRMERIIGIDEAGRGALAGPLVAAGVSIVHAKKFPFPGITDSKLLTDAERRALLIPLYASCDIRIGVVSNRLLDRIGLQAANVLAVDHVLHQFDSAGVIHCDYIAAFERYTCFAKNITFHVHGELQIPEIAAASIVAKVYRDDLMVQWHRVYPSYNFAQHKGYGTVYHRRVLRRVGVSPIHRLSFRLRGGS